MDKTEKAIITLHDGYVAIKTTDNGISSIKYVSPDTFGKAMASGVNFDVGLLPQNCIAYKKTGFAHIFALTSEESVRDVRFLNRTNNKTKLETFKIPFPKLLWIVSVNSVSNELGKTTVHAIKDSALRMKSEIFYPPFSNIHTNGDVCWGNTRVVGVKYKSMIGLSVIPDMFFNLDFNQDLDCRFTDQYETKISNKECTKTLSSFRYLQDNKIKEFPYDILSSRNITFKTLWGGSTDEDDF